MILKTLGLVLSKIILVNQLRQSNLDMSDVCDHISKEFENLPGVIQLESNLSSFGKV